MAETSTTPMMRQYHAIRRDLPANTILLFRLGDFYEMFFEDAKEASGILNVALTRRGEVPMCGMPYHAAKGYIRKLIAAGKRVAVCDQVGEVEQGKLVRRELAQIITAGTLDEEDLDSQKSNFIAAFCAKKDAFGFAYVDLSTGEFHLTQLDSIDAVTNELARVLPVEILVPDDQIDQFSSIPGLTAVDGYAFENLSATALLCEHFKVHSLDGFGCTEMEAAIGAAAGALHYLVKQLRRKADHIRRLLPYRTSEYVLLDASTQSHLELIQSRAGRSMTLLGALDRTVTPMGARLLREWILHPLRDVAAIHARQQVISDLIQDSFLLGDIREHLKEIRDIERSAARLSQNSGNARDLSALASSLRHIPVLKQKLEKLCVGVAIDGELMQDIYARLHDLPEFVEMIFTALVEELPPTIREGNMFRDGFDAHLDELRSASREGKRWIANLQEEEIKRTGIKSLKVRFNSVFGYFIEITKSNLSAVPSDYIRKQTTVNGERYITPPLKEIEGKILGADERSRALEIEIFQKLRSAALEHLPQIQETAAALAALDILGAFAETARLYNYVQPEVDNSGRLLIRGGRHPVLEQTLQGERFVPNDTNIDSGEKRFAIITGPNMAGKSTYIRQVALLTLMAQIGSFLPADEAHIGLVDRIFTRVGANDDLARGQSTFMVEMNETANIVNNATVHSLIILDEIGRGTSTFDGLSIAWSVAEYLHDKIGARTFFATHYHELTEMERTRTGVVNLNVAVREWNDQIIFLRKILPGRADQSYGIQVARLAGLPDAIIHRAREILTNLEQAELNAEGKPVFAGAGNQRTKKSVKWQESSQMDLI
ncbi:MAG: DNA mismatch repair protein MutS [Chthoniobacterales bacterium]